MTVASTSVNAYHTLQHEGTQSDRTFEYVSEQGSATIAMIAKALHMEKSTVSARVNGLVNGTKYNKTPRLEFSHIGKCPVTNVLVKFWKQIEYMTADDMQAFMDFTGDRTSVSSVD